LRGARRKAEARSIAQAGEKKKDITITLQKREGIYAGAARRGAKPRSVTASALLKRRDSKTAPKGGGVNSILSYFP